MHKEILTDAEIIDTVRVLYKDIPAEFQDDMIALVALPEARLLEQAILSRIYSQSFPTDAVMEFVKDVSEQGESKPDYWSSCGQCESNTRNAEDLIERLADPRTPADTMVNGGALHMAIDALCRAGEDKIVDDLLRNAVSVYAVISTCSKEDAAS